MKLTREQLDEMLEVAKPLIKWLNEHAHPHCSFRVDQTSVELVESVAMNPTLEFLKD